MKSMLPIFVEVFEFPLTAPSTASNLTNFLPVVTFHMSSHTFIVFSGHKITLCATWIMIIMNVGEHSLEKEIFFCIKNTFQKTYPPFLVLTNMFLVVSPQKTHCCGWHFSWSVINGVFIIKFWWIFFRCFQYSIAFFVLYLHLPQLNKGFSSSLWSRLKCLTSSVSLSKTQCGQCWSCISWICTFKFHKSQFWKLHGPKGQLYIISSFVPKEIWK